MGWEQLPPEQPVWSEVSECVNFKKLKSRIAELEAQLQREQKSVNELSLYSQELEATLKARDAECKCEHYEALNGCIRRIAELESMYKCACSEADSILSDLRICEQHNRMLVEALKSIERGCSFPEDDIQRAIRDRARQALKESEGVNKT